MSGALAIGAECGGVSGPHEHLGRRYPDWPRVWNQQCEAGVGVQRISSRLCGLADSCWSMLARRLGPRQVLVVCGMWWGSIYGADRACSSAHRRQRATAAGAGSICTWRGRSDDVSGNESVRRAMVSCAGTRQGKWDYLRGSGAGSGLTPPLVTAIILHYGWRASFWFSACIGMLAGLVWYFVARDTPEQHPWVEAVERDAYSRWPRVRRRSAEKTIPAIWQAHDSMVKDSSAAERLSRYGQLLFLWLCGVDILRLDVHLHGASARAEPQDQRHLRDVSLHRNDDRLPVGWRGQRLDCYALSACAWAVADSGSRIGADGGAAAVGIQGARRADGGDRSGAWGRAFCISRRAASGQYRRT